MLFFSLEVFHQFMAVFKSVIWLTERVECFIYMYQGLKLDLSNKD